MRVLFVSSFGPDMFAASGTYLVRSFLASGSEGTLLLCEEDNASGGMPVSPRILRYSLDKSNKLARWLAANRDIIPPHLGGSAEPCACSAASVWDHAAGCAWGWFNKNAARWFRKVVSLEYAASLGGHDAVVWLDSDCKFKKRLTAPVVSAWFGEASVFYLKSKDRAVVESGVIGFRLDEQGRAFVRITAERFYSGEFRRHPRWDDGYQFQVTIDEHPEIASVDLAYRALSNQAVVPASPLGKYLKHNRGLHGVYRVMV